MTSNKLFFLALLTFFQTLLFGQEALLKVGMELSYPPFETISEDGTPSGLSVDIANALGVYLRRPIQILNIAFVGLVPSLNSEKIDLIISSFTITEKRKMAVDFSIPYARNDLCLLVNAKSQIQGIQDVNKEGVTVVVKLGTSGEAYAEKNLLKANIRVLSQEGLCALEVIQGKADVFIYDQLSVFRIWQKNLNTTKAILTPFEEQLWAIAVRKGNLQLLAQVNAFLLEFHRKGGFEKLADKYLPTEKSAFEKLKIPFML